MGAFAVYILYIFFGVIFFFKEINLLIQISNIIDINTKSNVLKT